MSACVVTVAGNDNKSKWSIDFQLTFANVYSVKSTSFSLTESLKCVKCKSFQMKIEKSSAQEAEFSRA